MQLTVEQSISQNMAPRLHPSVQWSWVKMWISRPYPSRCGELDLEICFPKEAPHVSRLVVLRTLKNTGSLTMTLSCGRGFKGQVGDAVGTQSMGRGDLSSGHQSWDDSFLMSGTGMGSSSETTQRWTPGLSNHYCHFPHQDDLTWPVICCDTFRPRFWVPPRLRSPGSFGEGTTIFPDADPIKGRRQHKEKVTGHVAKRSCNCKRKKWEQRESPGERGGRTSWCSSKTSHSLPQSRARLSRQEWVSRVEEQNKHQTWCQDISGFEQTAAWEQACDSISAFPVPCLLYFLNWMVG